jgi:hypothetical protein
MSILTVSVVLTSRLVTLQLHYAVCSCAVIWGRMSILTVSVVLTSMLVTVQLRCAVCSCAVIWGRMYILTVSVVLTSRLVTLQLRYAVCSYMGKDVDFDRFSCINQQACHLTVALCCVELVVIWGRMSSLTVSVVLSSRLVTVQLRYAVCSYRGKDVQIDCFSCIKNKSRQLKV